MQRFAACLMALFSASCGPMEDCSALAGDIWAFSTCRMAQSAQRGVTLTRDDVVQDVKDKAEAGDPEAQYMLGKYFEPNDARESWLWNCRAAMQHHRTAQSRLGWMYRWGVEPVPKDPVYAYMWYALAASDEDPHLIGIRDKLADGLTPEQLAAGDDHAARWRPDACEMPVGPRAPEEPT